MGEPIQRAPWAVAALCLLAAACGPPRASAPPAAGGEAALIPRAALFGNPERTQARLSPDGKWVTFLAPKDGYLNIFAAPADQIGLARQITHDHARGVKEHFWAQDSAFVLYEQDSDGDENWVFHAVDIEAGLDRVLTPAKGASAIMLGASPRRPDKAVFAVNDRDPAWHDVYEYDVRTGRRTLLFRNPGRFGDFVVDQDNVVRLAIRRLPSGDQELWALRGAPRKLLTIPFADTLTTWVKTFDADGKSFLMVSSVGRDKAALVRVDAETGAATVLGADPKADVDDVWLDPASEAPEAFAAEYLTKTWTPLTAEAGADIAYLTSVFAQDFEVVSRTRDNSKWIVVQEGPTDPARSYLYDRKAKTLLKVFNQRPNLEDRPLQAMHPVEIAARDGLILPSYLTLPAGSGAGGDLRPGRPAPLVLSVHGGPWDRDYYGLSPEHQWLANRGYAVLSVNFRGSTGFGKAFANAGDREWGAKMESDLLDAADWAVRQGIAARGKIAILGGSYGGYAVLAGLAFHPEAFACGVDVVGPSNLETLLSSVPAYWKAYYDEFAMRVGDPRTPEGRALLHERSPLFRADAIAKPLLIAHGANDPRVRRAESDRIVAAMKARGLKVVYLLYPDEGHGFARPQNRMSFYAVAEGFLASCLGGRAEPVGEDLKGSSVQFLEGGPTSAPSASSARSAAAGAPP
jgi:dipeptidyl aminopeptidase/acylaminoacyl peptidase